MHIDLLALAGSAPVERYSQDDTGLPQIVADIVTSMGDDFGNMSLSLSEPSKTLLLRFPQRLPKCLLDLAACDDCVFPHVGKTIERIA